jgi:hypothetical protein
MTSSVVASLSTFSVDADATTMLRLRYVTKKARHMSPARPFNRFGKAYASD